MLTAPRDSVLEAELDPVRFADLVLALLRHERDPQTHAGLLGALGTALRRWLQPADAARFGAAAVELLLDGLKRGPRVFELQAFRFLARHGAGDGGVLALCERLLAGDAGATGATGDGGASGATRLRLGLEDRYLALAALIAANRGGKWVESMTGERTPVGAERFAFQALAAAPDAATKARYFATYLQPDQPPEQWLQDSLGSFHWPGQEALTLPFLRRALERLVWVKEHRKIFFLPAWIDAFVNAHSDGAALGVVDDFLRQAVELPLDVRRKVLQSVDGLRRAVRIKATWG